MRRADDERARRARRGVECPGDLLVVHRCRAGVEHVQCHDPVLSFEQHGAVVALDARALVAFARLEPWRDPPAHRNRAREPVDATNELEPREQRTVV